jgi:hypothetical protein
MRNMKAGLAMFESIVDILMSFIFEVVLIDFLNWVSFIYVYISDLNMYLYARKD